MEPSPNACLKATFSWTKALPGQFSREVKTEPYYSKAMEIVGDATDDYEKARRICEWMDANLKYDYSLQKFSPRELLETGEGVCEAYTYLTKFMFDAVGIPCGIILNYSGTPHSWNYALIDGVIVFIDNTHKIFDCSFAKDASHHAYSEAFSGSIGCSDWAQESVRAASSAGLTNYNSSRDLSNPINREQFAELVMRLVTVLTGEKPDISSATFFSDCDNEMVIAASVIGIVTGVGDNRFDPKAKTNREQIAAMIARAIDYISEQTGVNLAPTSPDISRFSDKNEVSSWAVDCVGKLAANGIMSGTSATTLSPKDPCTEEQSIILLYRFYQQFKSIVK